jgi:hypothetical protein
MQMVFTSSDSKARLGAVVLAAAFILVWHAGASAHEGPPFPLFVDKSLGPYVVSVWADPDVGTGTFIIVPGLPQGGALPDEVKVQVCVRPASNRLNEACYTAERDRAQYKIAVPFESREIWCVRIVLQSSLGNGEATTDVEVTPPGLGRWDLLLYLFPFIAIGFIWLRAMLKGRSPDKRLNTCD